MIDGEGWLYVMSVCVDLSDDVLVGDVYVGGVFVV